MAFEEETSFVPSTPVRKLSNNTCDAPDTPSTAANVTPSTRTPSSVHSYASSFTSPFSAKPSPALPSLIKSTSGISRADLATNWRQRAQMNGIKVEGEDKLSPKDCYIDLLSQSRGQPYQTFDNAFDTPSPKRTREDIAHLGAFTAPPISGRRSFFQSPYLKLEKPCRLDIQSLVSSLPGLKMSSASYTLPSASVPCCSVCDKGSADSGRMIVLSPCTHVFCSSCFTGTLNIVGEKNMSCMECNSPVKSFHFATTTFDVSAAEPLTEKMADVEGISSSISSSNSANIRHLNYDSAVLRIDNVPWDVTPPMLQQFINRYVFAAHILLDAKGKTLSHAFVQLSPEDARITLRSLQNAILGRGKRARAVTITLSSPEELMTALYPSWRGTFKGAAPSLDGLDNARVSDALQHGLISNTELSSLLNIITTPDNPFLKVLTLPFYYLISLLSTFPSDIDSQIFWTSETRDTLFLALRTLNTLNARREGFQDDPMLYEKLRKAAVLCQAFTESQRATIAARGQSNREQLIFGSCLYINT